MGGLFGLPERFDQFSRWVHGSVIAEDEIQVEHRHLGIAAFGLDPAAAQGAIDHRVRFSQHVEIVPHIHDGVFAALIGMFQLESWLERAVGVNGQTGIFDLLSDVHGWSFRL